MNSIISGLIGIAVFWGLAAVITAAILFVELCNAYGPNVSDNQKIAAWCSVFAFVFGVAIYWSFYA